MSEQRDVIALARGLADLLRGGVQFTLKRSCDSPDWLRLSIQSNNEDEVLKTDFNIRDRTWGGGPGLEGKGRRVLAWLTDSLTAWRALLRSHEHRSFGK